MYWFHTALMLEKKQLHRLTCNHEEINFYFKQIDEDVHIITLVDATKRYYYEANALSDLKNELERKFLLRGAKSVNVLFVIYTKNISFYKSLINTDLKTWLVDIESMRLVIYENQPDDFLGLKKDIEASLKTNNYPKKHNYPIVTIILAIANIAVFLFMYVFSKRADYYMNIGCNDWTAIFMSHEFYRLFTCMFIHTGADHLVNNMISLAIVGNETENRLGHILFSIVYLVSGLLSSLASAFFHMYESTTTGLLFVSIGASGAIFGIYGAYIVITLLANRASGRPISVYRIVLITFLLISSGFTGENVDNMAHLAGLIVGIIISFIYCKCDKSILKYH